MAAPLKAKSIKFTPEQLEHLRTVQRKRKLNGLSQVVKLMVEEDRWRVKAGIA